MNVTVLGLWHLGCVTAACSAKHFSVIGLDFDESNISKLNSGVAPLLEPELNGLIVAGLTSKKLSFTTDPKIACAKTDVLWVCYDTPVNENDESDVDFVLTKLRVVLPYLPKETLVLISSQLPVGTCRILEVEFPHLFFAYSPENLRLGKAIDAFENAQRVVVGIRNDKKKPLLEKLFAPFTKQILFMRTESAEMVKHSLNSFLALSISFMNEIARLSEHVGADAKEVSLGLKSEPRIGLKAYLNPGGPFAGGTLARDVVSLTKLAIAKNEKISLIPAIKKSNDSHRNWAFERLQTRLSDLHNKNIAILGLTYTIGTDTLRRSSAIELSQNLISKGANVRAFDPVVKKLPEELKQIQLVSQIAEVFKNADAVVVSTEWPELRSMDWPKIVPSMCHPVFIDANRFLENELRGISGVEHISVGRVLDNLQK